MNKKRILLILIFILSVFVFSACNKKTKTNVKSEETPPHETIETKPAFSQTKPSIEEKNIEAEVGETVEIVVKNNEASESRVEIKDQEVASFEYNEDKINVTGLIVGETELYLYYKGNIVSTVKVNIIEKVIFVPVPTGKILLKGIDKEASVKVIITKDGLSEEDIVWEVEGDCVSVETQGAIAHFKSLSRGKATVTVKLGNYSNTFVIYVTNIRGDLD